MSDEHRQRLKVVTSAQTRIRVARDLLLEAVRELETARFGVAAAIDATKRSADSASLAVEHVCNLIQRIPA